MVKQTAWATVTRLYGGEALEAYFQWCEQEVREPSPDNFVEVYKGFVWVAQPNGSAHRKQFKFLS